MKELRLLLLTLVATTFVAMQGRFTFAAERIPIIYSTDLLHPHDDLDDHYDLATLFSLREFEIKGIILDLGERQAKRPGTPALNQMMQMAGRKCPFAIGLDRPLRTRTDKVLEADDRFQAGIGLIISILRESSEKVVIHTAGSCRDVAAAFNREPALFKEKVRAVYMNIGNGDDPENEWNAGLDVHGYRRLFESGLPLFWCPCFGSYQTAYQIDQAKVIGACTLPVQNYFVYCVTESKEDPIAFLRSGQHPLPKGPWTMYCTAPMLHAAGRKIYERGPDDFVALSLAEANTLGLAAKLIEAFDFVPMLAKVEADGAANPALPPPEPGHLVAAYQSRTEDRVGTDRVDPDGFPDCRVRIVGLDSNEPIKNIIITGPNRGRWELIETGRWWRLAYERQVGQLDCFFHFCARGEHEAEIAYVNGKNQSVHFTVPATITVTVNTPQPNGFVFRATHPKYSQIMASCLKNLLADLPKQSAEK